MRCSRSQAARQASAICYSLTLNHSFVDGNKRVGHAAMEIFLLLNDVALMATVDDQERVMLELAAGQLTREALTIWLEEHTEPLHP